MIFKDRYIQFQHRYELANVTGSTYDLTQVTGEVDEEGTPINAENLNNLVCYDKVIQTQAEFNTMVSSSTWLDAKSILIVGGGGDNTANPTTFASSTNGEYCFDSAIEIPSTVRNIKGLDGAEVWLNGSSGLYYATTPTSNDYSIQNLTINNFTATISTIRSCINVSNCIAKTSMNNNSTGFYNCENLINCYSDINAINQTALGFRDCKYLANCSTLVKGIDDTIGFNDCENLINCYANASFGTYAFYSCDYAVNCSGVGATNLWGGSNRNISIETCRKTPVTANNTTLNT